MSEPKFNFVDVLHSGRLVAREKVDADLAVEAQLEQAWRATQNIEGSWSVGQTYQDGSTNFDYNPFVTVMAPLHERDGKTYGLRSSMVGDLFVLGDDTYEVDHIGFRKSST